MVGGKDGHAVAAPHAEDGFERARRGVNAPGQRGVGQRCAGMAQRHLLGGESRIACNQI